MSNYKLLSFSIIFSVLTHFLLISNFSLKKNNEVYVVNLSEYQEFSFSNPQTTPKQQEIKNLETKEIPKKQEIENKKEIPDKKDSKKKLEKEEKNLDKDRISLKKIEDEKSREIKKPEKVIKEKIEDTLIQQNEIKNLKKKEPIFESNLQNKSVRTEKKKFSLESKPIIVDKLLSEYLTFVSFEINKAASKSYPLQSIKRREQGKIVSVLTLDKNGKLLDIKFENKSPKRLYRATIKILEKFSFPTPPKEVLNPEGRLKIKIPVNFILK